MQSFADIMFKGQVLREQEAEGSRAHFERAYQSRLTGPLDENTRAFIASRDSFYLASVSEEGWPYVQHRGGPRGFLKILGEACIGFADYRGNRQLISKAHVQMDDRVALFLMDYARRARLKMLGRMQMFAATDRPDLVESLAIDGQGQVERVALIELEAIDWNCSKYITPRYTEDEVTALVAPHLEARDETIRKLCARLEELGEDPRALLTAAR